MVRAPGDRSDSQLRGQAQDEEAPSPRRWLVLTVLAAVAFMANLDLLIVNVALPAMAASFRDATLGDMSWVLNGYSIVFAALLIPAGRLADHFGRRKFLLAGVLVFVVSSAICAVAPNLAVAVVGRILQGVGAAMIVPTSLSLLWPVFPKREHNLVVGIWAGVAAVAGSFGPTIGGLLVAVDWRWIFLINVPIGVVTVLGGLAVLPEVRAQRGTRLPDAVSTLSLLAAVALLTLFTVQGSQQGWTRLPVVVILVIGIVATVVTVWRTLRHPHALIESRLFRSREFSFASVALLLFFVAFAIWLTISVLFLEEQWHYSAVRAGLAIGPAPLTAAVFAINSGRIVAVLGRRATAVIGCLFFAAGGLFWLLCTPAHPAYAAWFLPGNILVGIGSGCTQAPLFAAASTLPADRVTTGSAMLNTARQVGSAFGIAILVALLGGIAPGMAGYRRGWTLLVVCAAAAAVCVLVARWWERTRHSAEPASGGYSPSIIE